MPIFAASCGILSEINHGEREFERGREIESGNGEKLELGILFLNFCEKADVFQGPKWERRICTQNHRGWGGLCLK